MTSRNLLIVFLMAYLLCCAQHCISATLPDWQFGTATDMSGWSSAGGEIALDKQEGALAIKGDQCRLISPLFDIKTSPWHLLEIEMRTNKSGNARMFFSDTTDEPYGGFREKWHRHIEMIGDGRYHKYPLLLCWQDMEKVIHIRLDPPGTDNAVKSIRVVDIQPAKTPDTAWSFISGLGGWAAVALADDPMASDEGALIKGNSDALILSGPIDRCADDIPRLTLRATSKTSHRILFHWVRADRPRLHSFPVELIGDGKMHSYNIDLSASSDWDGTVAAIGLSPAEGHNPSEITLQSVSLGKVAIGPAEIKISRLELADPVTRAGDRAALKLEVTNTGGSAAANVNAQVTIVGGGEPVILPVKSAKTIRAAESVQFVWETDFAVPGQLTAVSKVSATNAEPTSRQESLRIYPRLDKSAIRDIKYVPEPKPANTGDYLVSCYYFPGWRDYGAWSVLNDYPERRPILGYAHNGNPEVVDWQIKWALEHGIQFFIYDWYWNKGGRGLEEGLHDGFLRSRYQNKMKFCLLWANHNNPGSHSEDDMLKVTQFWIDNYFKRDNYLKIDGKNVMVIFSPHNITADMGSDATRAAFEKMNKLCEDAHVGGIYFIACGKGDAGWARQLENEGYDAISGYNYPSAGDRGQKSAPYSWMVDAYKVIWNDISDAATIPYIPLCEAGWDSRPWHGLTARVRTGKSPQLWQKMLDNARRYCDEPLRTLPDGRKIIFCEAWNEFGEGDYIEPTVGDGFDYLEAIRQVFAPASDAPLIIAPKDIGLGPYDIPTPALQTSWDFSKPADRTWIPAGLTAPDYGAGTLAAQAANRDPMISAQWVRIDADKLKTLEIKMRMDIAGEAQMFFKSRKDALSEDKSVKFPVAGGAEYRTYRIDMSDNWRWKGIITTLRFDPTSAPGTKIEIAYIKFLP